MTNAYTDWYKLNKLPFRLRPDPDFLHLAGDTGHVFEALKAAVASGQGVIALLGESGVGKTTLLHAIARDRHGSMIVARVQQPNLTSQELVDALAEQFRLPAPEGAAPHTSARLTRFIAEEAGHGRTVLILVDEAHRCTAAMLKELLTLAGRQPAPLIVLSGEPELAKSLPVGLLGTLHLPRLRQVQIEAYLDYRLTVAGSQGRTLFDADTLNEFMRYTGGTPQLINMLADAAMLLGETHNVQRVGITEIRDAVQELKWVEFAAREVAARQTIEAATSGSHRALSLNITPELEVQQSGRHVSRMVLKPGRLVVGRAEDAGLRLDSQFVSRQHCQLITTAQQTFVEDLGSTNGILVNGKRRRLHRLLPEDKIVIGDHTLTYFESTGPGTT